MRAGRAFVLERQGAPMKLVERAPAKPKRGQVLVRNLATAINYHDIINMQGLLPNVACPRVPFSDNCGEIIALGEECGDWRIGDRVIANFFPDWMDGEPCKAYCARVYGDQIDGFLQDCTLVEAQSLVRAPAHMSAQEAATLACAGLTAWRCIAVEARVRPGATVVIQGTGGVSLFALQLSKLFGARVILLSSSDEKLELGRQLGADVTHNYRAAPAWDERVLEWTGGQGADLVVDIGGADTLLRSINAAKLNGHVSVIGVRSGFGLTVPIAVEPVLIKNLTLRGITVGSVAQLEAMCRAMEQHRLRPIIDRAFPLEGVHEAAALMQAQTHHGKIVIDIAEGERAPIEGRRCG
jgi:NADPH:quinone reductase-like Zn-dependent oxidoreductase